ncbi:MAG: ABC transporter permease [Planctomycetota bacterium]
MWKEWRGMFRQRGGRMRTFMTLVIPLAFFAVYCPWEAGERWLEGGPSILASIAVPLLMVMLVVSDSFAGERERHTLETLLASRLSDWSILLGKVLFAVCMAWGLVWIILALGLLTVNVAHWEGRVVFYSAQCLAFNLVLGLLTSLCATGAGVLISLRAGTVQEAQQTMAAVMFLPPAILGPIVLVVGRSWPEWDLKAVLLRIGPTPVFAIVAGSFLVLAMLLLWAAARRFQRERMS